MLDKALEQSVTLHLSDGTNLQNEDEIVHRLIPVEEVVLRCPLVLIVIFELLDDIWVLQQAQQNLFRHLHGCKWLNL